MARRMVVVSGPGVAGVDGGKHKSGGWSSGELEVEATAALVMRG